MGIRNALRLIEGGQSLTGSGSASTGIISPWQVGGPSKLVWSDIFGTEAKHINRSEAMTIPPVVKGRAILVSQIAPAPLRAYGPEDVDQPEWLYRTDGVLGPWHRMAWTIDDLIFSGYSLWGCIRNADGQIVTADRIPIEWWRIDTKGHILVNDDPVDEKDVILIPGPAEGFLAYGTRSLRGAVALEEAWVKRSRNPIPLVELHETVDNGLDEQEATALVQAYMDARNDVNGTVAFTPYAIELKAHGEQSPQLAIEGRNFVKVDVANFLNLPAAALDGSLSTASLTYSTQEGKRNEVADYSVSYWSDPIAARFSQDDVVPPGVRVRFDFADLRTVTPSPTGPTVKD